MSELRRICPKCGASYWGAVLTNRTTRKCTECGSDLATTENGVPTAAGYSDITVGTCKTVPKYKKKYGGGATIIN
jgi:uncharacterized protein (DUF983 family)